MIHAHALTKRYGHFTAVDSIDLDVPKGQVIGFLGPNGAGKSTSLKMISGFLPPTSGEISVAGFDVRAQSRLARGAIGYLPESTPLYPEMRVIEYLRFRARLYAVPRRERASAIDMVIRRCWLNQMRRKPVGQLSKGYKQRLGLAAALLHRPPVLLLDEPTSGLDPTQIREMRSLIRELANEHTVLLSTHILSEVEMTCDGIIIIAGGRIRAQGSLEEVRQEAARRTAYVVETNAPGAVEVIARLRGAADVRSRSLSGGWSLLRIFADHRADDLREAIATQLAARGGVVRELRREEPTLEQVFLQVTSGVETDASSMQQSVETNLEPEAVSAP